MMYHYTTPSFNSSLCSGTRTPKAVVLRAKHFLILPHSISSAHFFLGFLCYILLFMMHQMFSVGGRSGLAAGRFTTQTLFPQICTFGITLCVICAHLNKLESMYTGETDDLWYVTCYSCKSFQQKKKELCFHRNQCL